MRANRVTRLPRLARLTIALAASLLILPAAGSIGNAASPGAFTVTTGGNPTGPGGPGTGPSGGSTQGGSGPDCWGAGNGCCVTPGLVPVTSVNGVLMSYQQYIAAGSPNGPAAWQASVCGTPSSGGSPPQPPSGAGAVTNSQPSGVSDSVPSAKQLVYQPVKASFQGPALYTFNTQTPVVTTAAGSAYWAIDWTDVNGSPTLQSGDVTWTWTGGGTQAAPTCTTSGNTTTCKSSNTYVKVANSATVTSSYKAVAHCYEYTQAPGSATWTQSAATCTPSDPGVADQYTMTVTNNQGTFAVFQIESVGLAG